MKSVNHWMLCLLFLQALLLKGQDAPADEEVAKLMRNADDIRVVLVDNSVQYNTQAGYQSVLPEGGRALAQVFAEATLTPFRTNDGSNDPGGVASDRYLVINVRNKGELVGDIVVVASLVYVIKPGRMWHRATYKDAPLHDTTVSAEKSLIERRILGAIQASVKQGAWKEVGRDLKGFLHIDITTGR